jgi:hypothetical protein
MSDGAPHPSPREGGLGMLLLQLLAGLIVLLAGLTVVFVLPFVLVITAMGNASGAHIVWPVYLWVPAVFFGGIYTIVVGLGEMGDPHGRRILLLLGLAIIAFFSFPPFWLSGY